MNETKVTGYFDEAKGKLKQALGETFNNESLADSGVADQVKGHAKQVWGSIQDTARDTARNLSQKAGFDSETTPYNAVDPTYSTEPIYTEDKIDAAREQRDARASIAHAAESVKESIQRGLDHIEHAVKH
jgi:uncharacterized protein YjbJ (UPF0337 family)